MRQSLQPFEICKLFQIVCCCCFSLSLNRKQFVVFKNACRTGVKFLVVRCRWNEEKTQNVFDVFMEVCACLQKKILVDTLSFHMWQICVITL